MSLSGVRGYHDGSGLLLGRDRRCLELQPPRPDSPCSLLSDRRTNAWFLVPALSPCGIPTTPRPGSRSRASGIALCMDVRTPFDGCFAGFASFAPFSFVPAVGVESSAALERMGEARAESGDCLEGFSHVNGLVNGTGASRDLCLFRLSSDSAFNRMLLLSIACKGKWAN